MDPQQKNNREDDKDLPPEIQELLKNTAATQRLADEANEEYEEVFGQTQGILNVAESEKRIAEIDETITRSKASTLEVDAKIAANRKDLERMRAKVQDLKDEQKTLTGVGAGGMETGASCPHFQFLPCCSCSKWTLIGVGIGAFTIVLILVLIIVTRM